MPLQQQKKNICSLGGILVPQAWEQRVNKSSGRPLRLRSKDSFYSLGTGVYEKEAPKRTQKHS